jgi:tetratricopeptide (TPR) repeat protein
MSESNAAESALARGRAYLEILRIPEAKEAFEEALVDEPEAVAPRVELARLHLARGERAEAERRLAEAEQRDPRDPSVLATRGLFALRTGDVDEARAAFEAALAKTPDDRMALVNLAACDRDAGDLAPAETSLRRALEVDPDAFDARFELAAVLSRTGRTEEAIRELLETVRRNPMHLKSILALGALYKLGGRGELAMALYARGLVYNPDAHPLREELRDLLALRLDLHGALRQAGELVRRRRHPSDLLAFGKLAVAAGEIERAEGAFRLARDLAPDDWAPHYDLAEVHRAAGFEDEAREGYERAVERANGDHRPYVGLGLHLLASEGREEDARDLFARAVELAPERPEPRFDLALACARLGEHDAAIEHARAARELAIDGDTLQADADRLVAAIERERAA